jgi:uncharacterized membrane protein YkoI
MNRCTLSAMLGTAMLMATAPLALAYDGQAMAGSAKLTMHQAEAIAHKTEPGKIIARELEKEKGGSGLRYSFDIKAGSGKTHEVGVDAASGKVLENSVEGAQAD